MDFGKQIKAVRAAEDLSREEFAKICGLSVPGLKDIENGKNSPTERTKNKIIRAVETLGYFLTESGIEERTQGVMILYDYVDVLEDALTVLKPGEEILFHRADDRRSVPEVVEKMNGLHSAGLKMRSTICDGNTYIQGQISNYRGIPADYFKCAEEVEAIYADRVVIHERGTDDRSFYYMIKSWQLADARRREFEYWWSNGKCLNIEE